LANIAFFDFDGTITRKDTMLELAKYHKGNLHYLLGMLRIAPWMIALKCKLISATTAKEKFLSTFFGGMPEDDFNDLCKSFSTKKLPALIRPDALEKLQAHLNQGDKVVVVSASAENWLTYWCNQLQIPFLATRLDIDAQNRITGKLSSPNCNGEEKVTRIKAAFDPGQFENIFAYGDSNGDKPMLSLASHPFFRTFNG
jgi:HAD superfamily hydrolase (TIGR01490 family)